MTTRRGGVAVFAMIMVVSTMIVVMATVSLSGALRTKETRLESNRIVLNLFDGAYDGVRDMAARGILRLPQTVQISVNSYKVTIQLTDLSTAGTSVSVLGLITISVTAGTQVIQGQASVTYGGQTYKDNRVIDRGVLSTVWQYALYSNSTVAIPYTVTTGAAGYGGDVWVNGTATFSGLNNHIGGDITATNLVVLGLGSTVDGKTTQTSGAIKFPTIDHSHYSGAAVATWGGATLINYTFPSADATGYPILYDDGDLAMRGVFTGTGVIYVRGNLTINGNVTVSAGSHLMIICEGTLNISGSVTAVSGYLFTPNTFVTGGGGLTMTGGVVAGGYSIFGSMALLYDPWIRDNPPEALKLRTPGVW